MQLWPTGEFCINPRIQPRFQGRVISSLALQKRSIRTEETPTIDGRGRRSGLVREVMHGNVVPTASAMVVNRIWSVSRTMLEVLDPSFLVDCHGIAERSG